MANIHYEKRFITCACGHKRIAFVRIPTPEVMDEELLKQLANEQFERLTQLSCSHCRRAAK